MTLRVSKHFFSSLLLAVLVLIPLSASAQTWDEVKGSQLFIHGEGFGATLAEADRQALADLVSKIAMNISAATDQTAEERANSSGVSDSTFFRSVISTYAQATLTNTERVILSNEPDAHVGRWIRRSEIDKIFADRKLKINSLIETAGKAEQELKIDDALRCYYWAYTLLRSLQHPNEMTLDDEEGRHPMLMVWLPEKIKDLLGNVKTTVVKRDADGLQLRFTYKGRPVTSIDYTYFDGMGWSSVYSAKDGLGVLDLPQTNVPATCQIKYEFEYAGQAHIDKEMESVMNVIKSVPFKEAYTSVKTSGDADGTLPVKTARATDSAVALQQPAGGMEAYAKAMSRIVDAVQTKHYDAVDNLFTPAGLDIYNRLLKYGQARVVGTPAYTVYQDGESVIGRGVQMSFSFRNGLRKAFVENLVFSFDKQGKISNIAFGLGKQAADDILGKGVWSETARKAIMDFLENYQTAYALKRLDYIKNVFDDDAVIITGHVVRKQQMPTMYKSPEGVATIKGGGEIIKYNHQTKDEYIRNLAKCFASNEFVNIRFANNDVIKMGKGGETYAIQIAQDYYSANYGDKGYLFLIVDINNPSQPLIKVRTWQPDKDPNFGLYGPGDF